MTSTTAFTAEDLTEALADVGLEDCSVYPDYSGRGMCGDTCFGVVLAGRDLPRLGLALACADRHATGEHDIEELTETVSGLLGAVRLDNMGRDSIAYFPGWVLS